MPAPVNRFTVLVYRMPAKPTAARVAVWRQLKKIGAIYLQQSVCVFPANAAMRKDIGPILQRVGDGGGEFHLLPLRRLSRDEEIKLIQQFQEQTSNHYQEIIENCEVNFTKEIEFETFRKNFTYEEAEEIRAEYEKIGAWFDRVRKRDWFGAPNEREAKDWLERCEAMLEQFESRVFEHQEKVGASGNDSAAGQPRRRRRRPRLLAANKPAASAAAG
ncbi:MAG TPA: Chromate resistance protein ChrB [Candidatus Dormibacteraeota bacterium]